MTFNEKRSDIQWVMQILYDNARYTMFEYWDKTESKNKFLVGFIIQKHSPIRDLTKEVDKIKQHFKEFGYIIDDNTVETDITINRQCQYCNAYYIEIIVDIGTSNE